MDQIPVSKFKATCLAVLRRVQRDGRPVQITRFGKPIAEVVPPSPERPDAWIGTMRHTGRIVGDIVAPAADDSDWEVLAPGAPEPAR